LSIASAEFLGGRYMKTGYSRWASFAFSFIILTRVPAESFKKAFTEFFDCFYQAGSLPGFKNREFCARVNISIDDPPQKVDHPSES
jgi:hypothetical protein